MKINIEIRVSGPGMTFNGEFEAIRKMLEEQGCELTVINSHPPTHTPMKPQWDKTKITLIANHQPWGG